MRASAARSLKLWEGVAIIKGCAPILGPPLLLEARNRAFPHAVAAGQFGEGRALHAPPPRFFLLLRREFRRSAHMLPALLRPAAALGGARADKIALHVRQSAAGGKVASARLLGLR